MMHRVVLVALVLALPTSARAGSAGGGAALIDEYLGRLRQGGTPTTLASVDIPVVACPRDGQLGYETPPKLRPITRAMIPDGLGPLVAFYTSDERGAVGVLAPKGWHCHGSYGSNGETLPVTPTGARGPTGGTGNAGAFVRRSVSTGDTSGRFHVAHVAARMFPQARGFVERVRDEGLDEPSAYVFAPFPADRLTYLSRATALFATAAGQQGVGIDLDTIPTSMPVSGLVALLLDPGEESPDLVTVSARFGPEQASLLPAIIIASLAGLQNTAEATFPGRGGPVELQSPSVEETLSPF